jgi:phage gpG-like protein
VLLRRVSRQGTKVHIIFNTQKQIEKMNGNEAKKQLAALNSALKQAIEKILPARAAEIALSMFNENFRREAFFGQKWKVPQRRKAFIWRRGKRIDMRYKKVGERTLKRGKNKGKTVGIMKRRAGTTPDDFVRKTLEGRNHRLSHSLKKELSPGAARIYADMPGQVYPEVHNTGARAGRGKGFTMPKRQFIGKHKILDAAVNKLIRTTLTDIIKKHT